MNFSLKRRNILKAGAATILLPPALLTTSTAAAATDNRFGILHQPAPELEISDWIDPDGKPTTFKLADHKGKYVFMEFWQAWCPGCHKHGFPGLKKISDAFADNEHFIAIAIQTTFEGYFTNTSSKMRKIQKQYDLNVIMGHDPGNEKTNAHPKTMVSYRSGGTPWAVLINPEGYVIYNDFTINPESAIKVLKQEIKKISV